MSALLASAARAGNAALIVAGWAATRARWWRVGGSTSTAWTRRTRVVLATGSASPAVAAFGMPAASTATADRFSWHSRMIASSAWTCVSTSNRTVSAPRSRRRSVDRRPGPGTGASTRARQLGCRSRTNASTIRAWAASWMSWRSVRVDAEPEVGAEHGGRPGADLIRDRRTTCFHATDRGAVDADGSGDGRLADSRPKPDETELLAEPGGRSPKLTVPLIDRSPAGAGPIGRVGHVDPRLQLSAAGVADSSTNGTHPRLTSRAGRQAQGRVLLRGRSRGASSLFVAHEAANRGCTPGRGRRSLPLEVSRPGLLHAGQRRPWTSRPDEARVGGSGVARLPGLGEPSIGRFVARCAAPAGTGPAASRTGAACPAPAACRPRPPPLRAHPEPMPAPARARAG